MQDVGFDAFTTFEEGTKNVMLFKPDTQLIPLFDLDKKSAVGFNKGGSVVERNPYEDYTPRMIQMKMRRRDKDTQGLADLEYLIEGGIRGAPTELTPGPEMYVPVVDELQSAMDAKESGVSALAALKEGNFGAAGLDGLMAMLAAAGAVPVVGRVPATIGKAIKKQKDRDYPDTNLGSRLSYEKQIQ